MYFQATIIAVNGSTKLVKGIRHNLGTKLVYSNFIVLELGVAPGGGHKGHAPPTYLKFSYIKHYAISILPKKKLILIFIFFWKWTVAPPTPDRSLEPLLYRTSKFSQHIKIFIRIISSLKKQQIRFKLFVCVVFGFTFSNLSVKNFCWVIDCVINFVG